jgi:hypothetical protein
VLLNDIELGEVEIFPARRTFLSAVAKLVIDRTGHRSKSGAISFNTVHPICGVNSSCVNRGTRRSIWSPGNDYALSDHWFSQKGISQLNRAILE